ncbi:MAG: PQQ-binding-like beta-propeller repeat protein [Deltaproteobacteria bacterium]
MTALDPTGHVRWTAPGSGHVFGAPAVSRDGATVYVADLLGSLAYLRASDGQVIRRVSVGSPVYGGVLVLEDGAVVVGARDGHVRAFGADGTARWDFATRDEVHSTPALMRDGTVVFGSDDGGIYGVRASNGTQAFRVATAGRVRSSASVDADGFVFVGSEDDMVYALDPHGAVAWRVSIGADVDSSPAITPQGWLVVGSDDAGLHALAPRTGR